MAPLDNKNQALIPVEKLRDYLLEASHPQNGGKAAFFNLMGYFKESWELMADDLRTQHLPQEARPGRMNPKGLTYRIEAELRGPLGTANIRSIWQIDFGTTVPKLVTAYPIRSRR